MSKGRNAKDKKYMTILVFNLWKIVIICAIFFDIDLNQRISGAGFPNFEKIYFFYGILSRISLRICDFFSEVIAFLRSDRYLLTDFKKELSSRKRL